LTVSLAELNGPRTGQRSRAGTLKNSAGSPVRKKLTSLTRLSLWRFWEETSVDARVQELDGIAPIERQTMRKVSWRLMPILMLGYFCAYLDRSNVGMAATTMVGDLHFSNAVFGFGAGLFFLGYFLAEIPSNLMLNKVGARKWLARILITWGIIAALTAFVWDEQSFYGNRVLLGLAEAGFYPGVLLYMTWWFPSYYRSRMMGLFQSASVISLFIGPPLGGLLLQLDGVAGMHGWQWLYVMEGLPPVIMCVVVYFLLTDRPREATWLTSEQRSWLQTRLDSEVAQREAVHKFSLVEAFGNYKMWLLTLAYFGQNISSYGLVFFLPLIVKGLGVGTNWIGVTAALPYICAFFAMIAWGYHSDITGERKWHVAGAALVAAGGLAASALIGVGHPVITMIALCIAMMGQQSLIPTFWSIPSAMLTGVAAAGGLAMINALGNLGGWFGPSVYGLIKDATGSADLGLLFLAVGPLLPAVCALVVGQDRRLERMPARATSAQRV
jgi:ACS family tartrate transporter-like MFS transporter